MKRILKYILLASAAGLLLLSFIGASYSDNGATCASCHEMSVSVEKWTQSAHEGIECARCHAGPGKEGMLEAKSDGVGQVARHFYAQMLKKPIEPGELHAQVPDDRCLSCHKITEIKPFNKAMDHQLHTDASFGCLDCHRRTAHGNYEERKVPRDNPRCQKCHGNGQV